MAQATFFKNYPRINLNQDGVIKTVTDLSRYVRSSNDLLIEKYEYFDYNITGAERPDQVSYNVYGNTKFYWVILVTNNIRNVWTDWPLGQNEFERYVIEKYGSIATAQSQTYRNIALKDIYKPSVGSLSELIIADEQPIDSTTITNYILTVDVDYEIKTNYRREYDLNEAKRKIKLVRPELVADIQNELRSLFGI